MRLPEPEHPAWLQVISGETIHPYESLATKIILGRLNLKFRQDSSPEATRQYIQELRGYFAMNLRLPKVQADLARIFDEGAAQ
ncbi:MAG: hypothetical protein FOGNACKC_03978 [Anaerolineae bacterium]|nr:hypothetical protein [Anaerolineae bacterium]